MVVCEWTKFFPGRDEMFFDVCVFFCDVGFPGVLNYRGGFKMFGGGKVVSGVYERRHEGVLLVYGIKLIEGIDLDYIKYKKEDML